jgi:hypothetical protein
LKLLPPAQRKIIAAFNSGAASREDIAQRSQYSVTSSNFANLLLGLSTLGILIRPSPGMVDLADWVGEIL